MKGYPARMSRPSRGLSIVAVVVIFAAGPATAQDVPFFETPRAVVDTMMRLADVREDDRVYDLGSGDGRIVIAAAVGHGAHAVGIELQPELITLSNENAEKAGVAERVEFVEGDLFETDFSEATVVMLYLQPKVNRRLAPLLLEQLAAGTRVVSHRYEIDDWDPVERVKVQGRWVFLYRIP